MTNLPDLPRIEGFPQKVGLSVLKLGKFWVNWDKLVNLVMTKATVS